MVLLHPFCCRTTTSSWADMNAEATSYTLHFWITAGNQGCSGGKAKAEKSEALPAGSPLMSRLEITNVETLFKCLSSLRSQVQVRAQPSQRQGHISTSPENLDRPLCPGAAKCGICKILLSKNVL